MNRSGAAPVVCPWRDGFALPSLGGRVPLVVRPDRIGEAASGTQKLGTLCEVLLDEGVLVSSDWDGDLGASARRGLARWAKKFPAFRVLELGAFFADDISNSHCPYPACNLRQFEQTLEGGGSLYGARETPAWGMMALTHNPYENLPFAFVGARVRQFEAHSPGLGYHLFNLIECALEFLAGAWSPRKALDWWQNEWDYRIEFMEMQKEERETLENAGEDPDSLDEGVDGITGYHSPDEFRALYPPELFTYDEESAGLENLCLRIKDGEAQLAHEAPSSLRGALNDAEKLSEALLELRAFDKTNLEYLREFHIELAAMPVIPILLTLDDHDECARLCDEYLESLNEANESHEMSFATMFDVSRPESLVLAVRRFSLLMGVLGRADELLVWMVSEVPQSERPTLLHTLGRSVDGERHAVFVSSF